MSSVSVRKPCRKPRGTRICAPFSAEMLLGDPLAVGRRAAPRVDRDVEDRAPRDAHQLGLREGRRLVVQPAQRARPSPRGSRCPARSRRSSPRSAIRVGVPGLAEIAARVAETAGRQDLHLGQGGRSDFHGSRLVDAPAPGVQPLCTTRADRPLPQPPTSAGKCRTARAALCLFGKAISIGLG